LATKKAKPNGQYHLKMHEVQDFIENLPVIELPNVGPSISEKLATHNITTVGQLQKSEKPWLQQQFGQKNGAKLWNLSRGIDDRTVQTFHQRKSIGTQISWGVRFKEMDQVRKFLEDVSAEVSRRMREQNLKGKYVAFPLTISAFLAIIPTELLH